MESRFFIWNFYIMQLGCDRAIHDGRPTSARRPDAAAVLPCADVPTRADRGDGPGRSRNLVGNLRGAWRARRLRDRASPRCGCVGPALGSLEAVVGLLIGLFGILWIVAGMGLLRLRSWAWWLAVIVSVLDIVVSIPALPASAVTPAVSVIILVYSSRSPPLLRAAAADGHASRVPR